MKRTYAWLLCVAMAIGMLAGCSPSAPASSSPSPESSATQPQPAAKTKAEDELPDTNKLVLYSNAGEDILNFIVPAFEAKYSVRIELIAASGGELLNRMIAEKDDPIADVAFVGGRSDLLEDIDLFQTYVSPNNEFMVDAARNVDGYFNGVTLGCHPILINRDVIDPSIVITGYEDLLQPQLYKQIAMGNAAKSNSAFSHLMQMLDGFAMNEGGQYESKAGWEYVEKLLKQAIMLESSGSIHKSVADGEYGIALTWEDPVSAYLQDGATNLEVVYPKECMYFGANTCEIIAGAKNLKNARLFVDFIQSEEVQTNIGQATSTRPARKNTQLAAWFVPYEEIEATVGDRLLPFHDEWLGENKTRIQTHFTELMTDVLG